MFRSGGRALTGLGALPGYRTQSNSECQLREVRESGRGG